jgi:hypothetical protein
MNPFVSIETPPFATALALLALTACGSASTPGDARGHSSALHANADAGIETLEACVARHVAEQGSAQAVTALSCPGDENAQCVLPDLSVLSELTNLTTLDLSYRCIADVAPIASLAQLERLELRGNAVEDILPLGALRALRSLGLANNPVWSSWGIRSQLPFSQWAQLEELDLSGTLLTNILPLSSLPALRVLDLSVTGTKSIRPLGPLTGLRELHVDYNYIQDLSALEGLTQLEVLTANTNEVETIEPLRRLGNLRTLALDDTCVTSCELAGVDSSCIEPRPSCQPALETDALGADLAVPIDYVEQFVPPVDFPVWTQTEVADAFERVRTDPDIHWNDARGNCDGRAQASADLLAAAGFPALTKVYAFGNLRPLTSNDASGFYWFDWHVAVAARTDAGFVVLDPALEPYPLPLRAWYERLVNSREADLNFSCIDYYQLSGPATAQCDDAVDASGSLLVDAVQDLRGAICNSLSCAPW